MSLRNKAHSKRSLVNPFSVTIDGCTFSLTPIESVSSSKEIEVPIHCWEMQLPSAIFFRSGLIDTKFKAKFFFEALRRLDADFKDKTSKEEFPLRVLACQACSPDTEWEQIWSEHACLAWLGFKHGLSAQIAHMVLPTEHFYTPKFQERPSEFFHKDVDSLVHVQNIDAWEYYNFWMAEEIEKIFEKLKLESLDTYTLEAYLKDYLIESRTMLARNGELEVTENILRLGAIRQMIDFPLRPEDDTATLEKSLIRARNEAKKRLIVQQGSLFQIARIIEVIEESHPELAGLKRKAKILTKLMGSQLEIPGLSAIGWGQKLMLMQLLHEEMGIISALSCDTGLERTSLGLAVQAATSILKKNCGVDEALGLALNWDEVVVPSANNSKWTSLANHFRQNVLKCLEQLCLPLSRHGGGEKNLEELEGQDVNLDFLNLLPEYKTSHSKKGEVVRIQLYTRNPETGLPATLTKEGHRLMASLI